VVLPHLLAPDLALVAVEAVEAVVVGNYYQHILTF
jgi:demethoxyubiquinone hydroxylase (CLK1/Coq7/Cat5 family)